MKRVGNNDADIIVCYTNDTTTDPAVMWFLGKTGQTYTLRDEF